MIFYGHQMGMSRQETVNTLHGEMLDMISCFAVYNGAAEEVAGHVTDYDDALAAR